MAKQSVWFSLDTILRLRKRVGEGGGVCRQRPPSVLGFGGSCSSIVVLTTSLTVQCTYDKKLKLCSLWPVWVTTVYKVKTRDDKKVKISKTTDTTPNN